MYEGSEQGAGKTRDVAQNTPSQVSRHGFDQHVLPNSLEPKHGYGGCSGCWGHWPLYGRSHGALGFSGQQCRTHCSDHPCLLASLPPGNMLPTCLRVSATPHAHHQQLHCETKPLRGMFSNPHGLSYTKLSYVAGKGDRGSEQTLFVWS